MAAQSGDALPKNKYKKLRTIGEGSFGRAILAADKNGNRFVLKEIKISGMKEGERKEARKEVDVLAKLKHPYIIRYEESYEDCGRLYIVMDYCEGGDLHQRITKQGSRLFSEDQILDWFTQLCLALKHVHDRKILHRDIKTSNIFLTSKERLRLGDFGIAKVLDSTCELAKTMIGTPYYLSPEMCEDKPYNDKSDIWAAGCVLYEMATLKHAFEGKNMKNLVLKIIQGVYNPISPRYSTELRTLLHQLFKRSARERPSINTVLSKKVLRDRAQKFLTDSEYANQFSHTVLHRQPSAEVPRRPISGVSRQLPKYDPSNKYSGQRKLPVKRPFSASKPRVPTPQRPISSPSVKRNVKKNDSDDKQDKLRVLMDKQQMGHILKAREDGWNQCFAPESPILEKQPEIIANIPIALNDKGGNHQLVYDKMIQEIDEKRRQIRDQMKFPPSNAIKGAIHNHQLANVNRKAPSAYAHGALGFAAAERARVYDEFMSRRNAALRNKQQVEGVEKGAVAVGHPQSLARNKPEADYLERLRHIRMNNFNERKAIKNKILGNQYYGNAEDAAEMDKLRKIQDLRKQADDRAQVLRKRLDDNERHDNRVVATSQNAPVKGGGVGDPVVTHVQVRRALPPGPGITLALGQVGAPVVATEVGGVTAALKNIGVDYGELRREKSEILKRLNENIAMEEEDKKAGRKAWGPPTVSPCMDQAGLDQDGRRQWDQQADFRMYETKQPADDDDVRKMWAGPSQTVMGAFEKAEYSGTVSSDTFVDDVNVVIRHEGDDAQLGLSEVNDVEKIDGSIDGQLGDVHVSDIDEPSVQSVVDNKPDLGSQTASRDHATTSKGRVSAAGVREQLQDMRDQLDAPKFPALSSKTIVVSKSSGVAHPKIIHLDTNPKKSLLEDVKAVADNQLHDSEMALKCPSDVVELVHYPDEMQGHEAEGDAPSALSTEPFIITGLKTGLFDTLASCGVIRTCSEPDLRTLTKVQVVSSEFEEMPGLHASLRMANGPVRGSLSIGGGSLDHQRPTFDLVVEENVDGDRCIADHEKGFENVDESGISEKYSGRDREEEEVDDEESNEDDEEEEDDDENYAMSDGEVDSDNEMMSLRQSMALFLDDDEEKPTSSKRSVSCFNNLEESRMELEVELGENKLIKVLKYMKAIHEDEDECMSQCKDKLVQELGIQEHLYDKILRLIIADNAADY